MVDRRVALRLRCRVWKLALADGAVLHEVLGLVANAVGDCPAAQEALAGQGGTALLPLLLRLLVKQGLPQHSFLVGLARCCGLIPPVAA